MDLSKQVVSLELAKQLKKLGFAQDSLWYWLSITGGSFMNWAYSPSMDRNKCKRTIRNDVSAYTVAELMEKIENSGNEFAIRYNDACCYYHFRKGNRGTGNMIEGFRENSYFTSEEELFVNALAEWCAYLKEKNLM